MCRVATSPSDGTSVTATVAGLAAPPPSSSTGIPLLGHFFLSFHRFSLFLSETNIG
ncbi:hypothetical protein Hanom_Chr05g00417811 [Helianthus anomalus]